MSDQCSETEKNKSIGDYVYLANKKHKNIPQDFCSVCFFTEESQKITFFPILTQE